MRVAFRQLRPQIQESIRKAEQRILPPAYQKRAQISGLVEFPCAGPREPWYRQTPINLLAEHLEALALPPEKHFADLGSGLGSACFGAAGYFDRVTGIEMNPGFIAEAEKIRSQFGIDNVSFRQADFMETSFSEFDVIYFFKPFADDFYLKIMEKLYETRPGTYLISHKIMKSEIYDPINFEYLAPLKNWAMKDECPYFPLSMSDFYTFIRR